MARPLNDGASAVANDIRSLLRVLNRVETYPGTWKPEEREELKSSLKNALRVMMTGGRQEA